MTAALDRRKKVNFKVNYPTKYWAVTMGNGKPMKISKVKHAFKYSAKKVKVTYE